MEVKSFVEGVETHALIQDQMEPALSYQYMFERKTSPWEMSQWDQDELQKFKVEVYDIDRLYHIYHFDDGVNGGNFALMARQEYKGKSLFVELNASCDYTGFDCQGGGDIFVTFNANIFFNVVIQQAPNREAVMRGLEADGYRVDEMVQYPDSVQRLLCHNPPMLKLLCHQAVERHQDDLAHYPSILPKILADSVSDFIHVNEAKEVYEQF